ncbi:MAG: cell division protein ZapA [candidate division Zixibacteria bacterium]|nr:cell division protein ZapA [candidate division Zixibacteria bacterium]
MTDTSAENQVLVNIFGEEYPIVGVGDAPYISKIADFLDARMKEVAGSSGITGRDRVAILAAMSIASELHEKREVVQSMDDQVGTQVDDIILRLDQALLDRS